MENIVIYPSAPRLENIVIYPSVPSVPEYRTAIDSKPAGIPEVDWHDANNCEGCKWHEKMCYALISGNSVGYQYDKQWALLWKEYEKRCPKYASQKKKPEGNGKHKGVFTGTLTMSPNDPYNEEDMVTAIKKIMAQQTCEVKRYKWNIEKTAIGVSHCHFMYECVAQGRIHAKVFARYWKLWKEPYPRKAGVGFAGGYHEPVKSEIAYKEYIEKDGGRGQSTWTDDMEV